MSRIPTSTRRLIRPLAGLTIAAGALMTLAGVASASSDPSKGVVAESCNDGATTRNVTVTITTRDNDFTTGFRVWAMSSASGPDVAGPKDVDVTAPGKGGSASASVTFQLPAGTYYFDWADRLGDGTTYTARHSTLGSFYLSLVEGTETVVADCVIATTTTATTTTIPTTTAVVATTATAAVVTTVPVTTVPAATTTAAVSPPTTAQAATTAAVQATVAAASANTLPSTGSNSTPLIAAGVLCLGLGSIAVLSTRRRGPAHEH